jgi:WhiB family redox-sensing transcriptional regulator
LGNQSPSYNIDAIVGESEDWKDHGACRGTPYGMFYPILPGGRRSTDDYETQVAHCKVICAGCPVAATCREWALTTREPWGIWGGLTEDERYREYRRRGRAKRGGVAA